MKPDIKEITGGFLFTWPDLKLSARVNRLHMHQSDGSVTGYLVLLNGSGAALFAPTKVNFSSEPTRSHLIKTLSDKDERVEWFDIINQIATIVTDRVEAGEPVNELWTSEDIAPPEWLLEPILYRNLPTIIFGEKGTCKSTLGLVAYLCLILPWAANSLGWVPAEKPVKVLIADWEVDGKIAQHNLKKIQEGMDLPAVPLFHRRCELPLADDVEQLERHIREIGAQALIIDSLGPACGGNLMEPQVALRFSQALRHLKVGCLILGQTSKEKGKRKDETKRVFGSTFFEYYARHVFELRAAQENEEGQQDIGLYNTFHNLGPRIRAQGFHLEFTSTTTKIEKKSLTASDLIARLGAQAEIIKLLETENGLTSGAIKEFTGHTRGAVDVALWRLKNTGIVEKRGTLWFLKQHLQS